MRTVLRNFMQNAGAWTQDMPQKAAATKASASAAGCIKWRTFSTEHQPTPPSENVSPISLQPASVHRT